MNNCSCYTHFLDFYFRCPGCGRDISGRVSIPEADFQSVRETFEDSRVDDYENIGCSCGKCFTVQTTGSCIGNFAYIHGLDDEYPVSFEEQY